MAARNINVKLANGRSFPLFGLGTWQSKPDAVRNAVKEAIQAGYRHIDCASVYLNEAEVGAGIKEKINDGTITRDEVFVTSKLWAVDGRPDDVEEACRKSLTQLGLEYIDLYLMHWPISFQKGKGVYPRGPDGMMLADNDVDYVDTWKAMENLVQKGLVRGIGVSNYNKSQLQRILDLPPKYPICNLQNEMSPYLACVELVDFCKANGIQVTAYSPLGSPARPPGAVGENDPVLLQDPVVTGIAKAKGKTAAQVLIRFHIQRGVAVIPKSVTPSRIKENMEALEFELSDSDVQRLIGLDRNFHFIAFPTAKSCKYYPF